MLSIWELQVTTFQTPEDWVQVMTTMDEKGSFPSCDPLFATLTAEVLERDIVIVQADVGPNAPVSANTMIKGEVNPFFFIPPLGQNWPN